MLQNYSKLIFPEKNSFLIPCYCAYILLNVTVLGTYKSTIEIIRQLWTYMGIRHVIFFNTPFKYIRLKPDSIELDEQNLKREYN